MVALTLAESLQLLCIEDYTGRIIKNLNIKYSIPGAMILDLALEHKVAATIGRRTLITAIEGSETSNALHNEILNTIKYSRTIALRRLIKKYGRKEKYLRKHLLLSLEEKKIIERKDGLLKRYQIINLKVKDNIIDTIRNLGAKDPRTKNYIYCFITLLRIMGITNKISNTEFLETTPYSKESISTIADNETRVVTAFVKDEIERVIFINNLVTTVTECLECCTICG